MGSRAAAGKPEKPGGYGAASSPLHFSAGGDLKRKIQAQKPVDFSYFSTTVFGSASPLFSSNLPNLKLDVTRATDDSSGMWMSGSATSIFLLHFYTGGGVHRCHCWEIGAPFKSRFSAPFYCPSVGSPSVMADPVAGSISSSPPLQVAGGEEEGMAIGGCGERRNSLLSGVRLRACSKGESVGCCCVAGRECGRRWRGWNRLGEVKVVAGLWLL